MYKNKKIGCIIAAAGLGKRFGGNVPKLFLQSGKNLIIQTTVEACAACGFFDFIYVVTHPDYVVECKDALPKDIVVLAGGKERQDSVANGLEAMLFDHPDTEYVLVHDGARPYVTAKIIENTLEQTLTTGAAIAAVPVKDTIKLMGEAGMTTPERRLLFAAQTPQGFEAGLLKRAYEQASAQGFLGTDDAQLVERLGHNVALAEGSYANIKITTPEDLPKSVREPQPGTALESMQPICRAGIGFDVHQLVDGRPLILGGVNISFEKGLLGHSDADVLTHAIMDALLGAAGLGDIGRHFPDTDPAYKGISSMTLLKKVVDMLAELGLELLHLDATIIAQRPKLAPYHQAMINSLAAAMACSPDKLNLKATTTEKLGIPGREEGMAAEAICILTKGECDT
jgi:2-C-methyl-D-erythritol 4-phosphate cytidylyltransferase / 2-C-methyl-D-erythritol 2,4-cyclodiphosphate synthase